MSHLKCSHEISNCTGKATAAARWRMWALAKRKRPFLDAKLVKERTLETLEELFAGGKNKADIVTRVTQVPLSDSTAVQRVADVCNLCGLTISTAFRFKNTKHTAPAVDESSDLSDPPQASATC